MPLTRDQIQRTAERFGFTVQSFEPGPGTRADIVLQDEQSEQRATIGLWPCSSEQDLLRLIGMAIAELRGSGAPLVGPHSWLL
jgi:hypothetical protein